MEKPNIHIGVNIEVDQKTAEVCLSLLEIYCNANNLCIKEEQTDGFGVVLLFNTRKD